LGEISLGEMGLGEMGQNLVSAPVALCSDRATFESATSRLPGPPL